MIKKMKTFTRNKGYVEGGFGIIEVFHKGGIIKVRMDREDLIRALLYDRWVVRGGRIASVKLGVMLTRFIARVDDRNIRIAVLNGDDFDVRKKNLEMVETDGALSQNIWKKKRYGLGPALIVPNMDWGKPIMCPWPEN